MGDPAGDGFGAECTRAASGALTREQGGSGGADGQGAALGGVVAGAGRW